MPCIFSILLHDSLLYMPCIFSKLLHDSLLYIYNPVLLLNGRGISNTANMFATRVKGGRCHVRLDLHRHNNGKDNNGKDNDDKDNSSRPHKAHLCRTHDSMETNHIYMYIRVLAKSWKRGIVPH